MQYKTITLELIRQTPVLYREFRRSRRILPTLDHLARELKAAREIRMAQLLATQPTLDPIQLRGRALEMAFEDLARSLDSGSTPGEGDPSLEGVMDFARRQPKA